MASVKNNDRQGMKLPELRILLIGRTGQGKSTTGNSILGQRAFETSDGAASCTKEVKTRSANRFGCHIRVTDTPGLFDTEMVTQDEMRHTLLKCLLVTVPGLDAILFVLRKGEKFTPELQKTQRLFFEWFGRGVEEYAHLVLTHCNNDDEAHRYLNDNTHIALLELAKRCGERVIPINNRGQRKGDQVQYLVDSIQAVRKGKGSFNDIKYDVLTHIAKTRDHRFISPESLTIMKTVRPDIDRFLKSEELILTHDKRSSQEKGFLNIIIEDSDPMQRNVAANGYLTIIDVSCDQKGVYRHTTSITNEQFGNLSSDNNRDDSLNDSSNSDSLSDESELEPDNTTGSKNNNDVRKECTVTLAADIEHKMSESDSTFEESKNALEIDDRKIRKSENSGNSSRDIVAPSHPDRQCEAYQASSDTLPDDTTETVDENIRTFRRNMFERFAWFYEIVRNRLYNQEVDCLEQGSCKEANTVRVNDTKSTESASTTCDEC